MFRKRRVARNGCLARQNTKEAIVVEIIDVSKWFTFTKKMNLQDLQDFLRVISVEGDDKDGYQFGLYYREGGENWSKPYPKKIDCEYALDEFCKRIGEE